MCLLCLTAGFGCALKAGVRGWNLIAGGELWAQQGACIDTLESLEFFQRANASDTGVLIQWLKKDSLTFL